MEVRKNALKRSICNCDTKQKTKLQFGAEELIGIAWLLIGTKTKLCQEPLQGHQKLNSEYENWNFQFRYK